MNLLTALLTILLLLLILPAIQQQIASRRRFDYIRMIEKKRGSRLITLIDRRQSVSFLGLPFREFIDIEDSEEILRAIRLTPPNMSIDLVIHTPGGIELAVEQIAYALLNHPAKVTVFVPHLALSGGTLLALAADQIVMDENAFLGRIDPQVFNFPAISISSVSDKKPPKDIDDTTYIMIDIAKKAIDQTNIFVRKVMLENDYQEPVVKKVIETLVSGKQTHDEPVTFRDAIDLGLRVTSIVPQDIYELLKLYPSRRPGSTVHYIPVRYRRH
ncbi:MAG: SDH family Clp fold serine proteinase [Patescibacteria group bacterium]|jgi:ClpP class serine protease